MLIDDGTEGLSEQVIGVAIEIHREFGPGLLPEPQDIIDIVVNDKVLVEVKAVAAILPIHIAQVRTYLTLSNIRVGLIMNFNVAVLRHGIRRVLHPDISRAGV